MYCKLNLTQRYIKIIYGTLYKYLLAGCHDIGCPGSYKINFYRSSFVDKTGIFTKSFPQTSAQHLKTEHNPVATEKLIELNKSGVLLLEDYILFGIAIKEILP